MAWVTTGALQIKMVGSPTFDSATVALASACIYDAENEIRKRLAQRYDFSASPFLTTTTLPPIIVTLTETLAVGYMYENMARGSKEGYARADRYIKRVFENLEMINEGKANIVDSTGAIVDQIDGDWAIYATENYSPTFNEDHPRNWIVSQDKLDDIDSERD
jgi:hypothetical protein